MKQQATVTVLALVALAFLAGCTVDLGDKRIYNPQAEAQATRTAQLAADEAARRAIERQVLQAKADEARAEAQAAEATKPALIARNAMIALAIGGGVLVLLVGSAFAVVAWLNKRATSVYPDEKGQYPVMVRRGFGWIVLHDPNRGLGPSAVYRTSTALDVIAGAVRYLRTGRTPGLPQPQADFPATASEGTMAQIASQAQAAQLMAAATRPAGILGQQAVDAKEARQLATEVVRKVGSPGMAARMPSITVVDDPARIAAFEQRLLESEGA